VIHSFTCLGKYYILNANTLSLAECDRLTHTILPDYLKGGSISALGYTSQEINEAKADLDELKSSGFFNAKDWSGAIVSHGGEIKAMCLHAAHDCNLRCRYCFADTGEYNGPRGLMPAETGKLALDFLIDNSGSRKNLEVDFFGGEPMMNLPAVKEIVEYGRELEKKHDKVFKFTITTNGMNLKEDMLPYLNAEFDNIVISVDGRQQTHDNMRPCPNGAGSFEKILPAAKMLADSRHQQQYYVRGTFTAHNLDFSDDVLFLADQGFEQVSIEPVVAAYEVDYAITEQHIETIFDEYEKLAREYLKRRADGRWFNFFHFMLDLDDGPCVSKRLSGCGAGSEYIAVAPDGSIYPCHQFVGNGEYLMGNVHNATFNRAMQARFGENTVLTKEECSDCWCKFFCSGGCAANSLNFAGDISKAYELGCSLQKKRMECALAIWAEEKQAEQEPHIDYAAQ
jgi:uncharacterized protein